MGYRRISMGIQTISEKLLNDLGREGTTHIYERARDNIRKSGFNSFNVDLMYGFLHQNDEDFENTILYAINLAPDHITLYRNRYKGTKIEKEAGGVSLYQIIRQYRLAYKLLTKNGYMANVGKNTFSKIKNDYGTSDYLTKRVIDFLDYFKDEIKFVVENKLMEIKEKRIYLTNRGSDYINGVIPLFYSDDAKKELVKLYNKAKIYSTGEKEFLKVYNIEEYERPSLATDIILFALNDYKYSMEIKSIEIKEFSVVLIKRGEHPYMNNWALLGGFVQPEESVEIAAYRELSEEAGVSNILLNQLQVFSEPNRDPRAWIVSTAFVGITDTKNISLQFGEDAIDAKLFNINLQKFDVTTDEFKNENIKKERNKLKLSNSDIVLYALVDKITTNTLIGEKIEYKIIESDGIAFDHAKILLIAIDKLLF